MKTVWMVVNAAGLAVFAAFSVLQRNDMQAVPYYKPSVWDAMLWTGLYALVALMFGLAIGKKFSLWLMGAAAVFCLAEMVTTFPGLVDNLTGDPGFVLTGSQMSPDRPWVELSREFFGATLALAATGLLWVQRRWSKKAVAGMNS